MTKLKHTTLLLIGLLLNSLTTSAMAGAGYLGITSVPTGAQIYINNKLVGKTPYEDYNIKEGQYTIKAIYKDNTGSIYPAQSKQITINELDPRTEKFTFDIRGKSKGSFGGSYDSQAVKEYLQIGNVLVLSKPTGARVFINGDELKATPFSRKGVSIGRYNIEFKLNGQSLKGNFDIIKDKTVKLIADFKQGKIVNAYRQAKREQAKQAKILNNLGSAASLGGSHSCALTLDNSIVCWGSNGSDVPSGITAKQIALGGYHSCALTLDNSITCWGDNDYGQTNVPSGITAKQIALGRYHSCALTLDNSIACWGNNKYGQTNVPSGITAKQIALGGSHSCALTLDNSIVCWGSNGSGQTDVPSGITAKQIALGALHSCALTLDNSITCWGNNGYGQTNVPSGITAKQIALGVFHSCALTLDNSIVCWGSNVDGKTNVPNGITAKQIALGAVHSCALTLDNSITCWGYNGHGQTDVPSGIDAKQL